MRWGGGKGVGWGGRGSLFVCLFLGWNVPQPTRAGAVGGGVPFSYVSGAEVLARCEYWQLPRD